MGTIKMRFLLSGLAVCLIFSPAFAIDDLINNALNQVQNAIGDIDVPNVNVNQIVQNAQETVSNLAQNGDVQQAIQNAQETAQNILQNTDLSALDDVVSSIDPTQLCNQLKQTMASLEGSMSGNEALQAQFNAAKQNFDSSCQNFVAAAKKMVKKVIKMAKTFDDMDWNANYDDKNSADYKQLIVDLTDKIFASLTDNDKFTVDKNSIKILSVKNSAAGTERRRSATGKVVADYEIEAEFDQNAVSNDDLKAAVATSQGIEPKSITVAGAQSVAVSLMMILASMMFYL